MNVFLEAISAAVFTSLKQIAFFLSNTVKHWVMTRNQWKCNVQGTFLKFK